MYQGRKTLTLFLPESVAAWRPLANTYRTRDGWLLKFDLAGVRPDDVTVAVRGRRVAISGFRKDTAVEEGASYYSMEISYSRFERTIEMPCSLDGARISIEAKDGILLVRMVVEGE
jgi:HSP20 family protein